MEKKTFLGTWKDIPGANEIQYIIENVECTSDGISIKMGQNNASSLKGCVRYSLTFIFRPSLWLSAPLSVRT